MMYITSYLVSRAFDVVDHGILLGKLRKTECSNNVEASFSAYLLDMQQVVFDPDKNILFNWLSVTARVPQGSL